MAMGSAPRTGRTEPSRDNSPMAAVLSLSLIHI